MKVVIMALALLLSPTLLSAQQTPEWYRVYTFDESVIDMNTRQVSFSGSNTGRVRFRWSFNEPEALSGEPRVKYKSRLEVIEFDCSDNSAARYRPYELTLFDAGGKAVRFEQVNPPGEWSYVTNGLIMEKLYFPACQLIKSKLRELKPAVKEDISREKAKKIAALFSQHLEEQQDFATLIEEFFAPDFLNGYLQDKEINWFLVLNRDVAAKAPRAELQRFYVALLKFGYLSNLYFASQLPQLPFDPGESVADEKIIPPGMVNLVRNHPYLSTAGGADGNYDSLAGNIDSIERLRSYIDLMEKLGALFRKKVMAVRMEQKERYFNALDDLREGSSNPEITVCQKKCFGLPEGTKLFEVNAPVFRLQLAEINGEMKIVSAMPYFQ